MPSEQRETYKGHKILVRPPVMIAAESSTEDATASAAPELYIDDNPVVVVETKSGEYIAAGFAYAPQQSVPDLAKAIVDARAIERGH